MASINFTQNIGKTMPHGMAGNYARQPDMIVNTFPAGGTANIPFGAALYLDSGKVKAMGASATPADFIGIAGREFKSALNYLDQSKGEYAPNEAVSVFQRGCINVKCQRGTAAYGGAVYLRITENGSYSTAVVGGFEASADSDKTIELPFCHWMGAADANGVAELRIDPFPTAGTGSSMVQGVAVADAASTAPTAAEFKALLDSLRDAGIIAESEG